MKKRPLLILILALVAIAIAFFVHQGVNSHFRPMTNFDGGRTVHLDMDLENAVIDGIYLPSAQQTEEGTGTFNFRFIAPKKGGYYKIYYQNETYKFADTSALSNENFYGSWEEVSVGFKPVDQWLVRDELRIVGNPRDERRFYGADLSENRFSDENIQSVINAIHNVPEWYNGIVAKAERNGYSIEEQLYRDALWVINDQKNNGDVNHRWKRNPRVGEYSFLLVLCDEEGLAEIPDCVQHIGNTDENGQFVNPYGWFETHPSKHIKVIRSKRKLKTRAVLSVDKGVFIDESMVTRMDAQIDSTNCHCGTDDSLYKTALYEQFFSEVSRQYTLRNIPVIQDVVGEDPYTREQYEANRNRFDSTELQMNWPVTTETPCQTVRLSDDGQYISLINPGNDDPNNLRKESTGIRTRVGFTYGKFRGKIKFPVMLNDENIWNGLTYAFWLIYSDNHEWNNRRHDEAEGGYVDKNDDSKTPSRHPDYHYSEIDIEIVKASRFWPKNYYGRRADSIQVVMDETQNDDVMYCCTNWDLAVPSPEHFSWGIDSISYSKEQKFETLRWYKLYKALTERAPMSNKDFKEPWYYYEIEWRPTEIIWRLGPDPDHMRVMGYMNDEYTSIPNNQMKCIVTQEYHYSEWWPPIVWEQGLIPYNKTDIEGRVYEIVIE
ncbi:MAG: hypothetical protein K6A28_01265 [Bacteroidales bacterium]|nr:hypothetical protein [Bacteroidales bacterium]